VSGATSAAGSGAVLGAVVVFLIQQLGYLSLSGLVTGVVYLAVALVVGGLLGGIIRRALTRHQ